MTTIVEKVAESGSNSSEEAEKGASARRSSVWIKEPSPGGATNRPSITKLASGFKGPLAVVDARGKLREKPLDVKFSILVPVNGNEYSRRAAEVAIAIARAVTRLNGALCRAGRQKSVRDATKRPF